MGIYLTNVLAVRDGLKLKWYYPLSATYWLGKKRVRVGPLLGDVRQEDGDYEEIREDLSRLEKDGGVLTIEDLRKTFKNGFVAVKGLSVKMYTG